MHTTAGKGTQRDRKFCSVLCYQAWEQRESKKRLFLGMEERKRMMAMGVFHNDQLRQFAIVLNRTDAPQIEKEALMIDALREVRMTRRALYDLYRSGTKSEKAIVRKIIWRAPALKRPKGPFWCKKCGSSIVTAPNDTCQKCRDSEYHVDVPEIVESGDYRRHKDEDAV